MSEPRSADRSPASILAAASDVASRDATAAALGLEVRGEPRDGVIGAEDAACVVLVITPELVLSDWWSGGGPERVMAAGAVVGWCAAPVAWTASAIAAAPVSRSLEQVAGWVAAHGRGEPLPLAPAVGDVEPAPAYPDENAAAAGERLQAWYALRDLDPERTPDGLRAASALGRRKLQPGDFLGDGRWRLLSAHTTGTWVAWDRQHLRKCAIELDSGPWAADDAAVGRWRARHDAIHATGAPNLVPLVDLRVERDLSFVVREHRPGSLREAAGGLSPEGALQAGLEVAACLAALHDAGHTHGRLDPDCVWLSGTGEAGVASFGSLDAEGRRSLFAAPESLEPGWTPDERADVYGLGMLLLAALHKADLPFWVLREPERMISTLPVPPGIRDALCRAVDWDPGRRFPSMPALRDALLADDHIVAALAEGAQRAGRPRSAVAHLEVLLARTPGERSAELLGTLAALERAAGQPDRAFEHYRAALRLAVEPDANLTALGEVATDTGRELDLVQVLEEEADARGGDVATDLHAAIARTYRQLGLHEKATVAWNRVLEEHRTPERAREALAALAATARDRADWDAFVAYARDLLAYLPEGEQPALQYAIGAAYLTRLHDEQTALQWLDRAEAGGHSSIELARQLEEIRARRGQWSHAISLARRQAEVQPAEEAAVTLQRAAELASSVGLASDVTALYEALLDRAPGWPDALRGLARIRARAGRFADAVDLGQRLGEHATPADRVDHAEWLALIGRPADADAALTPALAAEPGQVRGLRLRARLARGRGDIAVARPALERVIAQIGGALGTPWLVDARLELAELDWATGDLLAAQRGFREVVEMDPDQVRAWWGLARIAMEARASGAERTPWLKALPERYTAPEALARLLMGVLDGDALGEWINGWAWGRAVRAGGAHPVRLACAAADAMLLSGSVDPELFRKFSAAWPEWTRPVEAVEALWFDGARGADAFPLQRSYRWSSHWIDEPEGDPDTGRPRAILAPPTTRVTPLVRPDRDDHWPILLSGNRPASPDAEALPPDPPTEIFVGPARIPALVMPGGLLVALARSVDGVTVPDPAGNGPLGRLFRAGQHVYLEAAADLTAEVAGVPAVARRLREGDGVRWILPDSVVEATFRTFEREDELPDPMSRAPETAAPPSATPTARPASATPAPAPQRHIDTSMPLPPMLFEDLTDTAARRSGGSLPVVAPRPEPVPWVSQRASDLSGDDTHTGEFDEVPAHAMNRRAPPVSAPPSSAPVVRIAMPKPSLGATAPSAPLRESQPTPRHRGAVEVMSGPERGFTRFVAEELTIGRGRESDIHIASDTQLSRIHCKVVARGTGYVLLDNGSTRGTVVNGRKISEVELKGGEVIMAGRTVFSFKLAEEDLDRSDDATEMAGEPS